MSGPELERDDDGLVRLHKLLARSGVASRRRCEELMLAGEVSGDGEVVIHAAVVWREVGVEQATTAGVDDGFEVGGAAGQCRQQA